MLKPNSRRQSGQRASLPMSSVIFTTRSNARWSILTVRRDSSRYCRRKRTFWMTSRPSLSAVPNFVSGSANVFHQRQTGRVIRPSSSCNTAQLICVSHETISTVQWSSVLGIANIGGFVSKYFKCSTEFFSVSDRVANSVGFLSGR